MTETIYTWARPEHVDGLVACSPEYFEPPTRSAVRLWGEHLLQLWCERAGCDADPPLSLRARSGFAWISPEPPVEVAASMAGRIRCRVRVDPDRCAVGRIDLINPVFVESGWRNCVIDLIERGLDERLVREELAFLEMASAPMRSAAAGDAVRSTGAAVLDPVIEHFAPIFADYVRSWRPMAQRPPQADKLEEVAFPLEAVEAVEITPP